MRFAEFHDTIGQRVNWASVAPHPLPAMQPINLLPHQGEAMPVCATRRMLAGASDRTPCVVLVVSTLLVLVFTASGSIADEMSPFDQLGQQYHQEILPLVSQYCGDCHSTDAKEGELDLERFATFADVRHDAAAWQKVAEMMRNGEMPPEDSSQPSPEEHAALQQWVKLYLDTEAFNRAGDPGPVVLRRLNNSEYTYTIRDLTGVELEPAKEFPVDSAAGEGFTNTGSALVMSPSLVTKYIDAAKEIAAHAVLLPDGFRFSTNTTRRDWTNEALAEIRGLYLQYTGRMGDANALNHWDVTDPTQLTDADGRVDLATYFRVLLENQAKIAEDIQTAEEIAAAENLSPKYLRLLAEMLEDESSPSPLFANLRQRWHSGDVAQAAAMAADARAWQQQLWKFNPVGHYGQVSGWQEPTTPLVAEQSFRVKLDDSEGKDDVTLYLVAGSAGVASEEDIVLWQAPRIEHPGRPTLLLRDLRATSVVLAEKRHETLAHTAQYLAAAFDVRTDEADRELDSIAAAHQVDPVMLRPWLSFLGISHAGEVKIQEYLHSPMDQVAGHDFVKGWAFPGASSLSLSANSSDEQVLVPGIMNPHSVTVHPRPERWVAAGWRSPRDGRFRFSPSVKDAHDNCGNGVSWTFELRRSNHRRVLASGNVDLGGTAVIELIEDLEIKQGDLVSLIIFARDQSHVCDLTQIDISIESLDDPQQSWSLAGDCADDILAGNPHSDRLGNPDVWHFYTGLDSGEQQTPAIPAGSSLARWLATSDAAAASEIAQQIQSLVADAPPSDASEADTELRKLLTAADGPLFSQVDPAELVALVSPERLSDATYGVDPEHFGHLPDGSPLPAEHLAVTAPAVIKVIIPAEYASGGELVVTGALSGAATENSAAQLAVVSSAPAANELMPGVPVVVRPGSPAEAKFQAAFAEFRELFPAAMCYPKIVPVDVVVTLVLFHREDHHLARLMLSEEEAARLDRLWDELHYVSQDALTIVTGFEQLLEFASQDDDPSKYEPLGEEINRKADAFRQRLLDTEPNHLQALIDFAPQVFRRPLHESERNGLQQLYHTLRSEDLSHEEAFRLTMARMLASPAFLYRVETPASGPARSPISDWELASRLSYFLWSSVPDEELYRAAEAGQLNDPEMLRSQARRMLSDERTQRMAIEFACQWLHVRDFDQRSEKSERHFPTFADLRDEMYEETVRFFADLFQNDGSLLDILDADHTFLNDALAEHYGVPGVEGPQWRRVEGVREHARGGILTLATTLAEQSGASRTSPILRGNWVSETLLGERLPRPPKDVPQLPETVPPGLSERQLIERHSSDEACSKCHARIDPYGFALENFDAIGRYRQQDAEGHPIDTKTTLLDGQTIEGIDGLRNYLLNDRRETFVRQFCRKLLGYALGRGVQLSDEPLLDEMMNQLAANEYRFSTAVETIILSDQFRMIRGRDFDEGGLTQVEPEGENTQ